MAGKEAKLHVMWSKMKCPKEKLIKGEYIPSDLVNSGEVPSLIDMVDENSKVEGYIEVPLHIAKRHCKTIANMCEHTEDNGDEPFQSFYSQIVNDRFFTYLVKEGDIPVIKDNDTYYLKADAIKEYEEKKKPCDLTSEQKKEVDEIFKAAIAEIERENDALHETIDIAEQALEALKGELEKNEYDYLCHYKETKEQKMELLYSADFNYEGASDEEFFQMSLRLQDRMDDLRCLFKAKKKELFKKLRVDGKMHTVYDDRYFSTKPKWLDPLQIKRKALKNLEKILTKDQFAHLSNQELLEDTIEKYKDKVSLSFKEKPYTALQEELFKDLTPFAIVMMNELSIALEATFMTKLISKKIAQMLETGMYANEFERCMMANIYPWK